MIRRIAVILSTFFLAFFILFISLSKSARINYAFNGPVSPTPSVGVNQTNQPKVQIDYSLPYPGNVLPDSPIWPLKALRDKVWLIFTFNSSRRVELILLFADKRLASSKILFERKKPELAFSTLSKAEKYLEDAAKTAEKGRTRGLDTSDLDLRLANAAIKHREVIEEIVTIAPEDAKPSIIKLYEYSKGVYASSRDALLSKGRIVPVNPFNGN